jgi:hypothetical protein
MSDKDRRRRPLELRAASADGCTGTSDMSLRRLKGADLAGSTGMLAKYRFQQGRIRQARRAIW